MNLRYMLPAAFAALTLAAPAHAVLVHDYELNGSLADALGGPSLTETDSASGSLGATGYSFAQDQGLNLVASAFADVANYSIETSFAFARTDGYRRILDFKARGSDTGLYNLSTSLNFYNLVTGPAGAITANQPVHVVFTRDGTSKLVTGYVDGVQQLSFTDSGDLAVILNPLGFFQDDAAVDNEASAGFVDFIRIYDTALTSAEVAALPGSVPEPASWALMLGGVGLLGGALRRNRAMAFAAA